MLRILLSLLRLIPPLQSRFMSHIPEIFFVDDDSFNTLLAERLFKKMQVRDKAAFFASGEQVIAWWKENRALPSVILLDHNMPGMLGLEMIDVLQNEGADFSNTQVFLMLSSDLHDAMKSEKAYRLVRGQVDRPLTETKLKDILQIA